MQKVILFIFQTIKNVLHFTVILSIFFLMVLILFWIQNIISVYWKWIQFLKPSVDNILNFTNNIFSFSFHFCENVLDITYVNSIILLSLAIVIIKLIIKSVEYLEDFYDDCFLKYKKFNEQIFNNRLEKNLVNQEKKISNYMLYIKIKAFSEYKHLNFVKNVDIKKQVQFVQKYVTEKVNVSSVVDYDDGYIYYFNDFDKVDKVIKLLFEIKKISKNYDYIFCIQIGNNVNQLKKLIDLQNLGKIIICADTLLRYNYNKVRKYKTISVGLFKSSNCILEVHEFKENK